MQKMSVKIGYLLVFRRHLNNIEEIGELEIVDYEEVKVHIYWL
jgi:hypothetical protein